MKDEDRARGEGHLAQLRERLLRHMPRPGKYSTVVGGLVLSRRQECNGAENCFGKPAVALVVQGEKHALIGAQEYRYGQGQCLVTGVDMPSAFSILNADDAKPFLALALELDGYLISSLMAQATPASLAFRHCRGASIAEADPDLMGAFLRLTDLLDKPEQVAVRAPLLIQEIHYLLLIGPHGDDLRQLNTLGSQSNQIARAITWLRENYRDPLQVERLARQVHMGISTFHRHFKAVTGLSPLQYHKRLRLYEAQRLMLVENANVGDASLAVGYESGAQFNREYKRLFGQPPHRDMHQRREMML